MRITKKEIAAKLGCAEAHIGQTIDDLLSALDEELTKRLAAEARAEAATKEAAITAKLAEMAGAESAQHRAEARELAVMLKAARQAPRPARTNTKTRRRM